MLLLLTPPGCRGLTRQARVSFSVVPDRRAVRAGSVSDGHTGAVAYASGSDRRSRALALALRVGVFEPLAWLRRLTAVRHVPQPKAHVRARRGRRPPVQVAAVVLAVGP